MILSCMDVKKNLQLDIIYTPKENFGGVYIVVNTNSTVCQMALREFEYPAGISDMA